jgi:hypothetical protein
VFWVISVYFNIRNTLPKFCPFLLGHPVYADAVDKMLKTGYTELPVSRVDVDTIGNRIWG